MYENNKEYCLLSLYTYMYVIECSLYLFLITGVIVLSWQRFHNEFFVLLSGYRDNLGYDPSYIPQKAGTFVRNNKEWKEYCSIVLWILYPTCIFCAHTCMLNLSWTWARLENVVNYYSSTFWLIGISQFRGFDDVSKDVLSNHVIGTLLLIHLEVLLMRLLYCTCAHFTKQM